MTNSKRAFRARGVALIVSNPRGEVLIVRELESKPHIGKYAGMFSPPMETSQDGEPDCLALARLVDEELPGLANHIKIDSRRRGIYRVVRGAWVSLYVGQSQNSLLPTPDKRSEEVEGHTWVFPKNALTLWLRQGAREMLADYIENRNDVICRHCYAPTLPRVSASS